MKRIKLALAGLMLGSLALSAHAVTNTWWSYDFSEARYQNAVTWTNAPGNNPEYLDTWVRRGEDDTTIQGSYSNQTDVLVLNTQGEDLTYTPTNTASLPEGFVKDTVLLDADIFFVGSDSDPNITDNSVQFALFLSTPEDGTPALKALVYDDDAEEPAWVELPDTSGVTDKSWHHVTVSLNYDSSAKSIAVAVDGIEVTNGLHFACGDANATKLNSVSFRGTGAVDSFTGAFYEEDPIIYTTHTFTGASYVNAVKVTGDSDYEPSHTGDCTKSGTFLFPGYYGDLEGSYDLISKVVVSNLSTGVETEYTATYDAGEGEYSFSPNNAPISMSGTDIEVTVSYAGAAENGESQTYEVVKVYYGASEFWTITFEDEDHTPLQSGPVAAGTVPAYAGATPTKAATAQYTYTFAGWSPALVAASADATYTATYSETVNNYTISWTDHSGTVKSEDLAYGATPTAPASDPETYVENGMIYTGTWPTPSDVTGTATYAADYTVAGSAIATVMTIADAGATTNVLGTYTSLAAAIDAAASGDTVVLLADDAVSFAGVTVAERVPSNGSVVIDKDLTIDGCGHTVTGVSNAEILNATGAAAPGYDMAADLVNGSNLLGFFVKSGDVTFKNIRLTEFGDTAYVNKFGYTPIQTASAYTDDLVLENVDIDKFNRTAVCVRGGTLTITGGTITANATHKTDDHFQQPVEVRGGTATIDGLTVESDVAYDNAGAGAIVAWGATTLTNVVVDFTGIGVWSDGPAVAITGEDTSIEATVNSVFAEEGGTITIADGDFVGALAVDSDPASGITVNGGTFDSQVPAEFAGSNLAPTTIDEDGKYTVKTARTVTFTADSSTYDTKVVANGEPVSAPAVDPEKSGYTFDAWQLSGVDYDFSTPVTADIELVASWTEDAPPAPEVEAVDPGSSLTPADIASGIKPAAMTSSGFEVKFRGQVGVTYVLVSSDTPALTEEGWKSASPAGEAVTCADADQVITLTDSNTSATTKFYKIKAYVAE